MGARTQKLDAVSRDVIGDNKSIVMPDPTWLFLIDETCALK